MAKNQVERKTISQLSTMYGIPQPTIRAALKQHELFKTEGAVELREIEGFNYPPGQWIAVPVFEQWLVAREAGERTYAPRASGAWYRMRLEPNQIEAVTATLAPLGITFEKVSVKKPKPAVVGENGTADQPIEHEANVGDLIAA